MWISFQLNILKFQKGFLDWNICPVKYSRVKVNVWIGQGPQNIDSMKVAATLMQRLNESNLKKGFMLKTSAQHFPCQLEVSEGPLPWHATQFLFSLEGISCAKIQGWQGNWEDMAEHGGFQSELWLVEYYVLEGPIATSPWIFISYKFQAEHKS